MKNIKLLKPQPSPKNAREPLADITNRFPIPSSDKSTRRSPSCSPCSSSRLGHYENKRAITPKAVIVAKYINGDTNCIKHKDKQGKFRIEFDSNSYYYC
jgi:hypothetical protein